jgi:hypothetical protein
MNRKKQLLDFTTTTNKSISENTSDILSFMVAVNQPRRTITKNYYSRRLFMRL